MTQYVLASNDIAVQIPDVVTTVNVSSEENKERNRIHKEATKSIPYRGREAYKAFSTLGRLSKLCDAVIVGEVIPREDGTEKKHDNGIKKEKKLFLDIKETILEGEIGTLPLNIDELGIRNNLKQGDRVLVFLVRNTFVHNPQVIYQWNFDKTKLEGEKKGGFFIAGGNRGCIELNNADEEKRFIATTKTYMQILRQPHQNACEYYDYLRQLVLSDNFRIREDARSELLLLIKTSDPSIFDTKRVLVDENIDDGIKDYLRLYWIPYVEKQHKR